MKTQLSKPARSKASYTDEYKQQALELWRASGRSAAKVAAELGIRPPLLYRWDNLAECLFDPAIGLPEVCHTVCSYDERSAHLLGTVPKGRLGIWGAFPPYAEDGSISLSTDPLDPACFRLWRLEKNQSALFEYVKQGKSTSQFSMLISSELNDSVLQRLASEATDHLSTYEFYVSKAVSWIEILGWTFFGLWDENEYGIALFADRNRLVRRELVTSLKDMK